jgi:hypothetical protein
VVSPSPELAISLSSDTLSAGEVVTLTVTHDGTPGTASFSLDVNGDGGGYQDSISLYLLVGGERLYLPVVAR